MIVIKTSRGFLTDMNTTALELIQAAFPDLPCSASLDAVVITVQPDQLIPVLTQLKNDPGLNFGLLLDVTAVDYLQYPTPQAARFFVVYTLRNWAQNLVVQVQVPVADPAIELPSATKLWDSANWANAKPTTNTA